MPLFRIFGIRVRMHWLLGVLVAVYIVQAAAGGLRSAGYMAVTMAIFVASVLVHELGHCWMARRQGGGAESILLWPLGGLAHVHYPFTPMRQILVAGIGPLTSLTLSAACFGLYAASGASWNWDLLLPFEGWWPGGVGLWQVFVLHAARLNLLLGLFNLLIPAYPLDGGQILYGFLTLRWGRLKAAELTAVIAVPIGLVLAILGFAQNNFIMGLVGISVLIEAWQLRQIVHQGHLDSHPAYGGQDAPYDYFPGPERPARKGWFARWRERRAQERRRREEQADLDLDRRVDQVLEKVSRQGIGSLDPEERRILDRASKRARERV
jgi:stage IV sporulation protein FB